MELGTFNVQDASYTLVPERRKTSRQLMLHLWRTCELWSAVFSFLGWLVASVDYELQFAGNRSYRNCAQNSDTEQLWRWLDVALTLISLLFLVIRHLTKRFWELKKLHHFPQEKDPAARKPLWKFLSRLVLECSILCVFPYPNVAGKVYIDERHKKSTYSFDFIRSDVCYTASEVLYALMFLRFFFVLRAGINLSSFMDGHSRKTCRLFGVKSNIRFALRALVRYRPFIVLTTFAVPTALLAAMLIRVFERPYVPISGQDFGYYPNSVYYTYISMTTIAYGDFYSWTELGRFVSILIGIWGMAVFSMMIYIIDTAIATNQTQLQAFRSIKRTRIAARFLDSFFYYLLLRKRNIPPAVLALALAELKQHGKVFRERIISVTRLQTLKEKRKKVVHITLEEIEHLLLKMEIKVGAIKTLKSRLKNANELAKKFCRAAFKCESEELP